MRYPTYALFLFTLASAFGQGLVEAGRKQFVARCAGCHGADGNGGERAPGIRATRSAESIRELIRKGIPDAGMPAFEIAEEPLNQLVAFVRTRVTPASENPAVGDAAAGAAFFFGKGQCGSCHMISGRGGINGPDLTTVARERTLADIERALQTGRTRRSRYDVVTLRLRDGRELRGFAMSESNFDIVLQDLDGHLHRLRREEVAELVHEEKPLMPPLKASAEETRNLLAYLTRLTKPGKPSEALPAAAPAQIQTGDWPTYHGNISGNRHSALVQIDASNVEKLAPKWIFSVAGPHRLEVTPLVVGGVMYVTNVNEAFALDARNGREIWHYSRPRSQNLTGDAAGGINRGVALLGDRVFLVTDNAHLLALHRVTGGLLWDVEMADAHQHYGATSAPLVVNDLVISGTSGGDEGIRGFVAAYKASTGERVWRFWTVPLPGEPLAKTWGGRAIEHPCAATWLTGTYDPGLNLLYWTTGNPCPDFNGDERRGDNLYSDSVLALKPETGELKWYYQFTPHDLHDWDSAETPMLVDADIGGRPRKLLVQANRNGFFYVLDRTDGTFLLAKPFVKKLTWASGIGKDGRPLYLPGAEPTLAGVKVCPSMDGASNWMSTAYNPATGLFYAMALEKCNVFSKSSAWWKQGDSFYGGGARQAPGDAGKKYLRAISLQTGEIVWEYPQIGEGDSWGGVLSTASGLVFFCEDSGAFAAVDAATGKLLWHFQTNQTWKASPMTYMVDGRQYVAVASGPNILAFGLP